MPAAGQFGDDGALADAALAGQQDVVGPAAVQWRARASKSRSYWGTPSKGNSAGRAGAAPMGPVSEAAELRRQPEAAVRRAGAGRAGRRRQRGTRQCLRPGHGTVRRGGGRVQRGEFLAFRVGQVGQHEVQQEFQGGGLEEAQSGEQHGGELVQCPQGLRRERLAGGLGPMPAPAGARRPGNAAATASSVPPGRSAWDRGGDDRGVLEVERGEQEVAGADRLGGPVGGRGQDGTARGSVTSSGAKTPWGKSMGGRLLSVAASGGRMVEVEDAISLEVRPEAASPA